MAITEGTQIANGCVHKWTEQRATERIVPLGSTPPDVEPTSVLFGGNWSSECAGGSKLDRIDRFFPRTRWIPVGFHWDPVGSPRFREVAVASALLEAKASLEARSSSGDSALILGAWGGHRDLCGLLLRRNAEAENPRTREPESGSRSRRKRGSDGFFLYGSKQDVCLQTCCVLKRDFAFVGGRSTSFVFFVVAAVVLR